MILPALTIALAISPILIRSLRASLLEVLEYDHGRAFSVHQPAQFIAENRGRKWIRTNARFQTYWAPRFWEAFDRSRVPADRQFDVVAALPQPARTQPAHGAAAERSL